MSARKIAEDSVPLDTLPMMASKVCTFLKLGVFAGTMCALSLSAAADEIRLKDGKKLNGVIVGYEDNMFKVKTDYGFVLVEKDKIASIIPTALGAKSTEPAPEAKSTPVTSKNAASATPDSESGRENGASKII